MTAQDQKLIDAIKDLKDTIASGTENLREMLELNLKEMEELFAKDHANLKESIESHNKSLKEIVDSLAKSSENSLKETDTPTI
jgi:hypothetical protein